MFSPLQILVAIPILSISAAILAYSLIKNAAIHGAVLKDPTSSVWGIGGPIAVLLTAALLLDRVRQPEDGLTPMPFWPLLALVMIAGSFSFTWNKVNTEGHRQKFRTRQQNKNRGSRHHHMPRPH